MMLKSEVFAKLSFFNDDVVVDYRHGQKKKRLRQEKKTFLFI